MDLTRCLDAFDLNSGSSLACLVSGGVDSMALLDLAARSRERVPFRLTAVHFNYHLRGAESDRDEAFVREAARKLKVPVVVADEPIAKGAGLQARVRSRRLERMRALARSHGWTHALMAHHADDQAETVLMRLLRGAGLRGMRGMEPRIALEGGLQLLRPLLGATRGDILRYAASRGIAHVEDSSNATDAYFRNRVRRRLLPDLEDCLPGFTNALVETGERALLRYRQCAEEARTAYRRMRDQPDGVALAEYFRLPQEERFLVTEAFLKGCGFNKEVTSALFREIEALLRKGSNFERDFGAAALRLDYGRFQWTARQERAAGVFELQVEGPGRYWIAPLEKELVLEAKPGGGLPPKSPLNSSGRKLFLDLETFKFPLTIRFLRPGDRFTPFGMSNRKKLQDYFTDRKIPRSARRESLLLTEGNRILGLIGYEISDHCRVSDPNSGCLSVYWARG